MQSCIFFFYLPACYFAYVVLQVQMSPVLHTGMLHVCYTSVYMMLSSFFVLFVY